MANIIENCCFITETQTMFSIKQQKQNLSSKKKKKKMKDNYKITQ